MKSIRKMLLVTSSLKVNEMLHVNVYIMSSFPKFNPDMSFVTNYKDCEFVERVLNHFYGKVFFEYEKFK
jgi:hypothetical protein